MPLILVIHLVVSALSATTSDPPDRNQAEVPNTELSKPKDARNRISLDLNPELLQRLNPEQILQIMREREITARERENARLNPPAIATISTIASFVFLALIIIAGLWISALKDRRKHETLRAIVEKGGQIPPQLLVPARAPYSDFRRGVVLVASGVGLAIMLISLQLPQPGIWTIGMIPGLIGVGYLIAWYFETRQKYQGVEHS